MKNDPIKLTTNPKIDEKIEALKRMEQNKDQILDVLKKASIAGPDGFRDLGFLKDLEKLYK